MSVSCRSSSASLFVFFFLTNYCCSNDRMKYCEVERFEINEKRQNLLLHCVYRSFGFSCKTVFFRGPSLFKMIAVKSLIPCKFLMFSLVNSFFIRGNIYVVWGTVRCLRSTGATTIWTKVFVCGSRINILEDLKVVQRLHGIQNCLYHSKNSQFTSKCPWLIPSRVYNQFP